ncbi:hypothetical protein CIPAW_11G184000, partial [Carya illinoinensis]
MVAKNSIFRYADGVDMLLGILGSIGDGLQTPLTMFILSDVITDYGLTNNSLTNDIVDKHALRLLYAAIGVGLSAFVEGLSWARTAERQSSRMRMEYLKSVFRQDVVFFDTHSAGASTTSQVVTLLSSDANSIQVALCEKIPDCLAYLSTFFFCHIFAFILSWRLTLAAIPLSIMFIAPGLVFGNIMMGLVMKVIECYGVAGGIAEHAISSIRTVYSYVGECQTLERFGRALHTSLEFGVKLGFVKGVLLGSMVIIYVGWSFQAWVGTYLVSEKKEQGGHVFVAGFYVLMGGLSVLRALPNLAGITQAKTVASRIFEMIDQVPAIDLEDKKGRALSHVRGEIEFKDIVYGSGKSTVIALLERFYNPSEGEIILDGYKISRLQLKWLRSQLGLVNQELVLFATSIKENILFGKEGASMDSVIDAAKTAHAHNFITKLPDGYETQVGQFGFQLSGGQKQRIAIARALLREPRILLLDEATSALDAQSERMVQEAIDRTSKGRTTIIIAHRLSTIRTTNLIVVLQAGRLVESASHNELMQMNGGQGAPNTPSSVDGRNHHKMSISPSPISVRSSTHSSPLLYPFSQAFSMGKPYSYSIQNDLDDDCDEEYFKKSSHAPSQWPVLGCLGALGSGAIQPINAYFQVQSLVTCFLRYWRFNFFTNILQHFNFAIMGERLMKRVRENLLEKLMTFEIGWFDQDENTSASICARLATEANMVRSLVGDRMSLLVQTIFGATFAYILGLVLTWKLSLVMISVQPLVIGSFYSRSVLMKNMAEKAWKAQKEGSQLASAAVNNPRTITALSSQKKILGLFGSTLGPRKASVKQSRVSGFGLFSSQFFNTGSTALAFWYGGRLLTQREIETRPLFQAFFILLFTAYIISDAGSMTNDLSKGSRAIQSVLAILDRRSEIDPDSKWGLDIKRRIHGRIELKNVFFSYPTRPDQMIFRGLCLKIDAGRTVALVGQSGSGKSTIIGIERFYDPLKGSIHIDEQEIKSYNLKMLRSHIALVSQEPTLFAGTIRENIVYGKENATESEKRKAAEKATRIGSKGKPTTSLLIKYSYRGTQLSGGQKQRIALARAILKNPSILLLDEATSALDGVSENLVQEALEKMMDGRTCVIVAHRLSTIQKANSIAVINNGP